MSGLLTQGFFAGFFQFGILRLTNVLVSEDFFQGSYDEHDDYGVQPFTVSANNVEHLRKARMEVLFFNVLDLWNRKSKANDKKTYDTTHDRNIYNNSTDSDKRQMVAIFS